MKRIFCLLLAACMMLSLCACGNRKLTGTRILIARRRCARGRSRCWIFKMDRIMTAVKNSVSVAP